MPKLIRLYIRQVLIGFGLSAAFVSLLLWQNVGNLGHLISTSDIGWIAVAMLFVFNGLVFAGAQFSIAIMRMEAKNDEPPRGGTRVLNRLGAAPQAVPVKVGVTGPPRT